MSSSMRALLAALTLMACEKSATPAPPPAPAPAPAAAPTPSAAPAPPAAPAARGPWNVVLLTIDSLRADMPWAGYERPIAPRLTELHKRAVAYTNGYATSSFTSKSLGGLLSGRFPSSLERTGAFFTRYFASNTMFCETLAAQQVPCVAGHAHAYLGADAAGGGFEQGFKTWKLVPGITFDYNTDPYVTSQKLTPLAIETLDGVAAGGTPFFAWFHYMDPHDEYKGHEESPHFGRRARDLYDEEVFFTDLWIGKLLDHIAAQPWSKRTVIVVSADHGEAFGEHGITRHAHELWEELVHVPLFFVVPGVAPRAIAAPRSHIDLAPTFLELLGAKPDAALPGTSLVSELFGAEATERDVITDLPEDQYNERRRTFRHGRHKLIAFGNDVRFSLFDLEADPKEQTDLFRKDAALASDMRARYREAMKAIPEVPPKGGIPKAKRD